MKSVEGFVSLALWFYVNLLLICYTNTSADRNSLEEFTCLQQSLCKS